jgi:predicted amidohydrolase
MITPEQVPANFPYREKMLPNIEQACGGSAVVDPLGNYISGPTFNKETLLYADCEAESISTPRRSSMLLDTMPDLTL